MRGAAIREPCTMKLQISLGQIDLDLGAVEKNFRRIRDYTELAARHGSQLVVFPELWSTAYDLENWRNHACELGKEMFGRLSSLAREHQIAIAGSILESHDGQAFNTMALYGADGSLVGSYRKVHLVPMLDEPRWLTPGDGLALVNADWGWTGLGICYDLRFPEMWRRYAIDGAKLLIIPAEWPNRRAEHWRTLLRARAIENQVFIAACNRVGETKGELFAGRSSVIDPWGDTLIEGDCGDERLLTVQIDLGRVDEIRSSIPVFKGRRTDLY